MEEKRQVFSRESLKKVNKKVTLIRKKEIIEEKKIWVICVLQNCQEHEQRVSNVHDGIKPHQCLLCPAKFAFKIIFMEG